MLSLKWEQIGNDGIFISKGKPEKTDKSMESTITGSDRKAKQLPKSAYVISNQYGNRYMYKGFNEMGRSRNRAGKISGITDLPFMI